mgnify:CR=1 FL=1
MGFFDKLKKINIFANFGSELTDDFYDELEESLILADTGMDTTLELVEEDTSLILFYGEDETRPLMDRVMNFSQKVTKVINIFDTKEIELPFTRPDYRKIVSPMVMYAMTERLSCHLEKERNHPLTTRRYYRQMEY